MGLFSRSAKKKPAPDVQELCSPDGKPLTKAERILGTSGLSLITGAQPVQPIVTSSSNRPWNADSYPLPDRSKPANRRDSFESAVTTFDQFVRQTSRPSYLVRSPTSTYSRQPSSIIEGFEEKETASTTASTATTHKQLVGRESESTLRSGYNSRLSPFSGSQTFSDLSPREPQWGEDNRLTKPDVYIPRSPAPPVLNRESVESSRRRTGRSDASSDYSRLEPVHRPLTAQPHRPFSPEKPLRGSVSQRDLSMHTGLKIYDAETNSFRPYSSMTNQAIQAKPRGSFFSKQQEEFNKVKEHVRRPPPGTRNWFDSFPELDEDDEDSEESEDEVVEAPAVQPIMEAIIEPAELEDTASVKAPEPLNTPSEELTEEMATSVSPVSRSTSYHSSLHDIQEGAVVALPVRPVVPPIPSAFSTSTIASPTEIPDNNVRASLISAITRQSTYGDRSEYVPSARQSEYAPSNRSSLLFARTRDSFNYNDSDDQDDIQETEVKTQVSTVPTPRSFKRASLTGSVKSVKSTRTTHSLPAFRSPPASPAYLTIPPQYTRKTPTKERTPSTRSRANTQGTTSGASRSSKSSDSGESVHVPAATQRMIAVTEEEAAFLELMRRKKRALAKHGVTTPLQPKYSSSVKRPKTSSGSTPSSGPETRQQWATVRSMSARSTKAKSTISSSLLDRFPASPTTMRRTTLPLSSYALPSPPPSAALPAIPPVPPLPSVLAINQYIPKTPTLFARRSVSRQMAGVPKSITPSIDATLSIPKRKLNTISVPTSATTPRLSPLTLDTVRLTRPSQSLPNPITIHPTESPISSSPPTPQSRHISRDIMIKEASSTRDSDSTAVEDEEDLMEVTAGSVEVPSVVKTMQQLETNMLSPAATSAQTSPEMPARSPISPLSPSWNRKSLAQSLYRKSYAPSPMFRQSLTSEMGEYTDEFADAMSTQASEHSDTPPKDVRSNSALRTVITRSQSTDSRTSATPRPTMPQLNFRFPSEGLLTPVIKTKSRKRPGGLSIDVTRANTGDGRRHSLSDTSRQSIASLQSLRSSLRHSQALITPAFIVEEIAEQVHMRPGFKAPSADTPIDTPDSCSLRSIPASAVSTDMMRSPVELVRSPIELVRTPIDLSTEPHSPTYERTISPPPQTTFTSIEPPLRLSDQGLKPLLLPQLGRYSEYGPRDSHISVNADVMAAWGELGGWKGVEKIA